MLLLLMHSKYFFILSLFAVSSDAFYFVMLFGDLLFNFGNIDLMFYGKVHCVFISIKNNASCWVIIDVCKIL